MTGTDPAPVPRRDLLALVGELRRADQLPAGDRASLMDRLRALFERLEPDWFEDLRSEGVSETDAEREMTEHIVALASGDELHPDVEPPATVALRDLLALVRELRRADRLTAEDRSAVLDRKRALVADLSPGWYEDLQAQGVTESDIEIEVTEYLEDLAAGALTHPYVEARPRDPQSSEWAAAGERLRASHAAAVEALAALELDSALAGGSFPDTLRSVIEAVAHRVGGSEELVESRPGCWEADHIRALAAGADHGSQW